MDILYDFQQINQNPNNMRTKKSLGQNFLRNPKILKKIADFAKIEKGDAVVEVGSGEGTLTELLLERAGKVIAIEKDERLTELLKEKFKQQISTRLTAEQDDKLKIITEDVLQLPSDFFADFAHFSSKNMTKKSSVGGSYKLVGNIPYYITGALFKKFMQSQNPPESITFVVQKEVANRIMARNGKESILSISIKVYGEPEYGGVVKAGSFYPKPKVDSAIISIRNINKEKFLKSGLVGQVFKDQTLGEQESKFFEILKAGFAHKRKLLMKNLEKISKETFDILGRKEIFEKCGIPEKARAENLSIENWVCLTMEFSTKINP